MLLPDCIKVPVGQITKTHGVKGELSVSLNPDCPDEAEALRPGDPVIMEVDGLDVPFFISAIRPRGAESILLTLDEIGSDTEAGAYVGKEIFVYADADSAQSYDDGDELTADGLIGYTITDAGKTVGRIADVREIGPDCWYFVLEDSEKLIPIADEMILAIDPDEQTVEMDLPEGLLEI